MNILFVNANLYGHINPTLGLEKKLTEKGHKVDYFCSVEFSEQVTKSGADWIDFGSGLNLFLQSYRPTDRHPFYMLMEYILLYDEVMLPQILDILKERTYDLIFCDSIFGGGCFLKQLTHTPVICSHSSFAMSHAPVPPRMLVPGTHPQLDYCYQILNRICTCYKIKEPTLEEVFISRADHNIVYTTREFNGDDAVTEPQYLFAGPSMERAKNTESVDLSGIENRKLLYISLGSLNTDFMDFYKMCICAFENTDYYVCMSIGTKCEVDQLGELPDNFLVKNVFPQLEILDKADAFITHAGFNSVNEALYFGVPMLAFPLVNDQHMTAKRLVSMNLGLSDNMKELSAEKLKDQIQQLLSDDTIMENCLRISHEMKSCSNWELTVEKLESYVNK